MKTMTRKTLKTLAAGLLAAAIGSASLAAPAAAGGFLSFSFAPANAEDAQALRTGLQLYSLFNGARQGGSIRQNGNGNEAGIAQNGRGNFGVVHQEGDGHSATLRQNGDRHSYGLFQFGRSADAQVVQDGYGESGVTFQFGW